jgi:SAM-dependent methyltransferase
MSKVISWDERYHKGETPWDTGQPSAELRRVVAAVPVAPCRAVEFGCGTGTNAVWLAQEGFEVTAFDLSPLALEQARQRAVAACVAVRFLAADVQQPPEELTGPFKFFFDRGCYHAVRREDVKPYLETLGRLTPPGALGLVLTGNAREPHDPGPPVVREEQLRAELGSVCDILELREFRFDPPTPDDFRFLGWSCLLRRRGEPPPRPKG